MEKLKKEISFEKEPLTRPKGLALFLFVSFDSRDSKMLEFFRVTLVTIDQSTIEAHAGRKRE